VKVKAGRLWQPVAGLVEPQCKLIHAALMSNALHVPPRLTVAEFQDWSPPAGLDDRRWHLIDGEASCMAPTSENHGAIQSEAAYLITQHLRSIGSRCRIITTPGVIPRIRSALNERIPDLGVTCSAPSGAKAIVDPLVLIEILSPSNEAQTRANVWAYTTIPTVAEILLLSSTSVSGELWRREPDGTWAGNPQPLDAEDDVRLECLGFASPMPAFYATTSLL